MTDSVQIYYGTSYFSENVEQLPDAFILQVIINLVNVFMTLPGLYAIDRYGRRAVLLVGALGMGVCQYVVSAAGAATDTANNYASAVAQFVFLCIYVSFFASSFGPAAWVVTGELFPLKVRAKCLSMVSTYLIEFVSFKLTP